MWALHKRNRNDPEIRAICNTIPDSPQGIPEYDFLYGYTDSEGVEHQGQVDENPELKKFFLQYPDVEKMVSKLVGIMRGFGRHASGFVISTLDLSGQRLPTMKMFDKQQGVFVTVTQYSAPMVDKIGLIKADILGVKTIQMVSDAMKYILERHADDLLEEDENGVAKIYRLPEDKAVFADFYNKKTDSSFQFSTDLIKTYLPQFAPVRKNDLSILTALVRPGSLDAKFRGTTATQYYVDVRNGIREIEYVHPDMEPILKETNGIFVFQEDVFKFLVNIADYSWEESDTVRSAIAKKKREVILKTFDRIREATAKRGWTSEQSEEICNQVEAFSRYSFNKSHSKCYGDLGYITVYLKHYYPLEWWTAVLNNIDDEDRIRKYVSVLGGMIKPPSLKKPAKTFTIQDECIRAPLSVLRGIGPATVDELVTKGPFANFDEFLAKINHSRLNVGHFTSLIKSRSADCFMDKTLDYMDARKNLMLDYMTKRKSNGQHYSEQVRKVFH
jgi:DNA polymerase-3 subunit alpha